MIIKSCFLTLGAAPRVRSIITAQADPIRYLLLRAALSRFIGWRTIRPTVVK